LLPFPAAAPHAQKAKKRIKGKKRRSRGYFMDRFCSSDPRVNKITEGHLRSTSQKYITGVVLPDIPQKKTSERFVRWLFRAECRSWHSLDSICLAGVNPTRVIDLALVAILQSL